MASIIPGYEYDIFISYRQKDNKYDGWVTEFVSNIKSEIEATFREDITLYFDLNPHDGLLETHDIDDSLKDKLKCLIFIPIISRTYCDPKSFAWEHEFKSFIDFASTDQYGLKIKLNNGNVASRVLPVRIYDLSSKEVESCEAVTGGVLRGIDFVFKSSGVNRPLRAHEDHPGDNINKTYYRDQINKVANSIKAILDAFSESQEKAFIKPEKNMKKPVRWSAKMKIFAGSLILMVILSTVILAAIKIFSKDEVIEKSIAVLPFDNISSNTDNSPLSAGTMETILNQLYKIEGLKIPPSTSSFIYKDSPIKEIASKLDVSYILQGNVSESGDKVRVIVRLYRGRDERLIWSNDTIISYTADNLFEIQSSIAKQVAEKIEIRINPDVRKRIDYKPTNNYEAFKLFLQAQQNSLMFTDNKKGRILLEKAISLDSSFADAYAQLAMYWISEGTIYGLLTREEVIEKAQPLLSRALQLDENSLIAHVSSAMIDLWYHWDFESTQKEYDIVRQLSPSGFDQYPFFTVYLISIGKFDEAVKLAERSLNLDKNSAINWGMMIYTLYFDGQFDRSEKIINEAIGFFPDNIFILTNIVRYFTYQERYIEEIAFFREHSKNLDLDMPVILGHLGIAYYKTGDSINARECLNKLLSKKSPGGSPSFFAAGLYSAMGDNNKAIKSLEKSYNDHEIEVYSVNIEPLFKQLRGFQPFKDLLKKMELNKRITELVPCQISSPDTNTTSG